MKLFELGKIGKLTIKNRVVMEAIMAYGPLTWESDGRLSERFINYNVARAKGGAGLIIINGAMTDKDIYIGRLNQLAEGLHDYGAKLFIQILPSVMGGRYMVGMSTGEEISEPVGPSANPCFFNPNVITRALSTEEVEQIVQDYEPSARRAKDAGVDGIEVNFHGAYFLDEFLSPLWNRRTDKYGGSFENRLRFSLEVIESIRKGVGPDFPLIFKFSLTHRIPTAIYSSVPRYSVPGGRSINEGLEIVRRWELAGIDAIDIDSGTYEVRYWLNLPTTMPKGCAVELAAMTKRTVKIPVIAVGKLGNPELAERVLQEGKADFIGLARPLLADPDWVNKVRQGRLEDIRPCVGDLECHKMSRDGKIMSCCVNPACGMEKELTVEPAQVKKNVLVVGGGPSGMEASRVAALRGHRVTLLEKGDDLGGNLIPSSVPGFKKEYRELIDYISGQIKKLGVDVRLREEATVELIEEMKPDVVIIATGSSPAVPDIPGVEGGQVVTAVDLLLGKRKAAESVAVIGGGMVGCETALYLAQNGKKVTVIEALDQVMRDVYVINRMHYEKLLDDNYVRIMTSTIISAITKEGVRIVDRYGKDGFVKADTIVLAVGFKPNDQLLQSLASKMLEVYAVGDCVQPRKVINAIWEGFRTARLI